MLALFYGVLVMSVIGGKRDHGTAFAQQVQRQFKWPEDTGQIGLTEEEVDKLENVIASFRVGIPQEASDITRTFFVSRNDSSVPRRVLVVNRDYAFVVLNRKGRVGIFPKGGAEQNKIKYVWECVQGSVWLKKSCHSKDSTNCIEFLQKGDDVGLSRLGLVEVVLDSGALNANQKLRYLEKREKCSLTEWFRAGRTSFDIKYIVGLIDGLRKIHSTTYTPSTFKCGNVISRFSDEHTLFHGDISPYNIVCRPIQGEDGSIKPQLMLTDLSNVGELNEFIRTPGWGSPECYQTGVGGKYKDLDTVEFMSKFGAVKDSWAMGLILCVFSTNLHPQKPLPNLKFVFNKLQFNADGKIVNESALANITQEEVDSELDALIEGAGGLSTVKGKLLNFAKGFLIVDPEKRPTAAKHFITM